MRNILIILLCCWVGVSWAQPKLILLPVSGENDAVQAVHYRTTLATTLGRQYTVLSDSTVDDTLSTLFSSDVSKTGCQGMSCYQPLMQAFNTSQVAKAVMFRAEDDYFLLLSLNDLQNKRQIYTQAEPCYGCDAQALTQRWRDMAMAMMAAQSTAVAFTVDSRTPIEQSISVKVNSDPSGARVYLGALQAGVTPYQNTQLNTSQVISLTLKKPLYHDKTVWLDIQDSAIDLGIIELEPAFGVLKVNTVPEGAEVLLGGKVMGVTPYQNDRLASGQYLLTLNKALYAPLESLQVNVRDATLTEHKYRLRSHFGTLQVENVWPEDAIIYLKRGEKNVSHFTSPREFPLSVGQYTVKTSREGYASHSVLINMTKGQTTLLKDVRLRPLQASIHVTSLPPNVGAEVWVANKKRGIAPMTLDLSAGEQRIEVRQRGAAGYEDIRVKDGVAQAVQVMLSEQMMFRVERTPPESRVRIMNIKAPYQDDMLLKPGAYDVEVSHPGYATWRQWVRLTAVKQSVTVELEPKLTSQRFIDNGNGTVTDRQSMRMWIKNSRCWSAMNWHQAQMVILRLNAGEIDCAGYEGGFNDWRLPSKQDWLSLIDDHQSNPSLIPEHPFIGVQGDFYWSESHEQNRENAWYADMYYGYLRLYQKSYAYGRVWPVRRP